MKNPSNQEQILQKPIKIYENPIKISEKPMKNQEQNQIDEYLKKRMSTVRREAVRTNTKTTMQTKHILLGLAAVFMKQTSAKEGLGHEGLKPCRLGGHGSATMVDDHHVGDVQARTQLVLVISGWF